jgi:hypothetical protein
MMFPDVDEPAAGKAEGSRCGLAVAGETTCAVLNFKGKPREAAGVYPLKAWPKATLDER